MSGEQLPRVWAGREIDLQYWKWSHGDWRFNTTIYSGDIFMSCRDRPTIDPAGMTELKTCKEIDWR